MTKKEIIDGLKFTVEMFLFDPSTGKILTEPRNDMDKTTIDACKGAIKLLEQAPKKGRWNRDYICSNCGCKIYPMDIDFGDFNYCPNCGSYMKEDKK